MIEIVCLDIWSPRQKQQKKGVEQGWNRDYWQQNGEHNRGIRLHIIRKTQYEWCHEQYHQHLRAVSVPIRLHFQAKKTKLGYKERLKGKNQLEDTVKNTGFCAKLLIMHCILINIIKGNLLSVTLNLLHCAVFIWVYNLF